MPKVRFKPDTPKYYDLFTTCHTHGWKNLTPFVWDDSIGALKYACWIDGHPIDVVVTQDKKKVEVELSSKKRLPKKTVNSCVNAANRVLGLDIDTSDLMVKAKKAGDSYVKLIKQGAGRLLRCPTLWEDAAKTLFTTNCSWALTKRMCEKVCSKEFVDSTPSGAYPFPPPDSILRYTSNELKELIPVGYRAEYFRRLSEEFIDKEFQEALEQNNLDFKSAYDMGSQLFGFGRYATTHLLILTGHYDEIPIDTVVTSYIKNNYGEVPVKEFIDKHFSIWGNQKWWGMKLEKMLRRQNWLGD